MQPSKFTSTFGNCRGFCRGKQRFSSNHLGNIYAKYLFPSKIYIQFATFNTYFTTKLSFLNKRWSRVDGYHSSGRPKKRNEKKKGLIIESSKNSRLVFPWERTRFFLRARIWKWQRGRSLDSILKFSSYIVCITSVV